MTKKCIKCGIEKDFEEFYKSSKHKDGRMNVCKVCHSKRTKENAKGRKPNDKSRQLMREKYRQKREILDSIKTPCVKCGDDRDWVIEFHHLDPSEKSYTISQFTSKSIESLQEELKKCVCLCANCHKEFHYYFGCKPSEPRKAFQDFMDENY